MLKIEIWDTGIGIAEEDHLSIFKEYHQIDNAARERNRGMGLGLSIVQRLADLLGHQVRVLSRPGKGSVFAIEIPTPPRSAAGAASAPADAPADDPPGEDGHRRGKVLIIEDDPEVRDLLEDLLKNAEHRVAIASDGAGALDFLSRSGLRPDIILADYNLPNGMTGLEAIARIRARLNHRVPAIILTGDISTETLREVALQDCMQLNKPVKLPRLAQIIQDLLPPPRPRPSSDAQDPGDPQANGQQVIAVIDDNALVREAIRNVLEDDGRTVRDYASAEAFLEASAPSPAGCLLVDANLPGMSGVALLEKLHAEGRLTPAIVITGASDVSLAVQAMKAGAIDFIEKPVAAADLLTSVDLALEHSRDAVKLSAWRADAARLVAGLTARERQVMDLVLAGHPSKNIAADLGISQRTVEAHRAAVMKKTGSTSLPALARMALAAAANTAGTTP